MLVRQHFDRKSGEYLIIASFAPGKQYICTFKRSKLTLLKNQELKVALKTISDQIWIVFTTCFHKQSYCLQSKCVGCNLWADINQSIRIQSSGFTSELQAACLYFFPWPLRLTAATQTSSGSSVLLTVFVSVLYPFFFFLFFSFSFFVNGLLYFGFYFQDNMRRGVQVSSDNPGLDNITAHSLFYTVLCRLATSWRSLTLSPRELRESTKWDKTLLISLQQDWRVV